jgi:NAD(P)H-dependent FMN reductase
LKNAIDWASRPEPHEKKPLVAFQGKVAALLSASPSALGGLRGLVTLRSILGNIGVIVLPDQVTVPAATQAFDASGAIQDAKTRGRVEALAKALVETTAKLIGGA